MQSDDVDILSRTARHEGHLKLYEYRLRHRLFGGGWSPEIRRELVVRQNAVCVLPYDPVRDAVVLIEQFRIAAFAAGLPAWLTEIPAGLVEDGEAPEDVARRELTEEAGVAARELHFICRGLSSSGMLSEVASVYCAIVDAGDAGGIHGLDGENEDIRVSVHAFDAAMGMLADGSFQHCHGIIALQWLAANRDRLRAGPSKGTAE